MHLRYRRGFFALLAAPLVMAQCQPACTPEPAGPAPVAEAPPSPATSNPVPTTSTINTVPEIPLGVTVEAACSAEQPAVHAVNDSDEPIVLIWAGQQRVLQGGEELLEPWPTFLGSNVHVDEVDWEALDLDSVPFDQGTLALSDAEATPACNVDAFSAALTFASMRHSRSGASCGPLAQLFFGVDADAPVGYDTLVVTTRLSTPAGGLADEDTLRLPMFSTRVAEFDNAASLLETPADLASATFGGEAVFHDEDGALPDRAVGLGGIAITEAPC
jgi:hypothetical protein